MERPPRPSRRQLNRADLPSELTPEALRTVDFQTLRKLRQHGNGVLDEAEQAQFDTAYAEVIRDMSSTFDRSLERTRGVGPPNLDPALRRSYQRTQARLAEQAKRARAHYPELASDDVPVDAVPSPSIEPPAVEAPTKTPIEPPEADTTEAESAAADTSPDSLQEELEQTSDTLDMLERIASLQQQQVEHQATQLLTETRSLFFAFLVSVAVIIAGVAPLVEADPHDRWLTIVWTVACVLAAGLVYVAVRTWQGRKRS